MHLPPSSAPAAFDRYAAGFRKPCNESSKLWRWRNRRGISAPKSIYLLPLRSRRKESYNTNLFRSCVLKGAAMDLWNHRVSPECSSPQLASSQRETDSVWLSMEPSM